MPLHQDGKGARRSSSEDSRLSGADRYWDLAQCLKHVKCPIERGARDNLTYLLELRHEIEHRSTSRIDDTISAKLQACCINFNDVIKTLFGAQYALERRLPIALQFVTFSPDQRALLKKAGTLPRHVEVDDGRLREPATPEQRVRTRASRSASSWSTGPPIALPEPTSRSNLVRPGSDIADNFNIALMEVEKRKYLPKEIVGMMMREGLQALPDR